MGPPQFLDVIGVPFTGKLKNWPAVELQCASIAMMVLGGGLKFFSQKGSSIKRLRFSMSRKNAAQRSSATK
jgi:hypothetical protein